MVRHKVNKMVSLDSDIADFLERKSYLNFSEWVRDKAREEFLSVEDLEKDLQELEQKCSKLRKVIQLRKSIANSLKLSNETKEYLYFKIKFNDLNASNIDFVFEKVNSTFEKERPLTRTEFEKVLKDLKEEINNEIRMETKKIIS